MVREFRTIRRSAFTKSKGVKGAPAPRRAKLERKVVRARPHRTAMAAQKGFDYFGDGVAM
jgi:hypothetical protein